MRKLLNKLLIKFGLLITKAPTLLSDKTLETSDAFPATLTEKVTVGEAGEAPENPLFELFSADTNVHKWHHYFDIYTRHFDRYRDRPITMLEMTAVNRLRWICDAAMKPSSVSTVRAIGTKDASVSRTRR